MKTDEKCKKYCNCAEKAMKENANRYVVDHIESECPFNKVNIEKARIAYEKEIKINDMNWLNSIFHRHKFIYKEDITHICTTTHEYDVRKHGEKIGEKRSCKCGSYQIWYQWKIIHNSFITEDFICNMNKLMLYETKQK